MSLLRLPPETLRQIFDQISPSFFQEDLGRLAVSKRWFEFALPACFRHLTLSQERIRRVVAPGAIQRSVPVIDNLESLELDLGECRPIFPTTVPAEDIWDRSNEYWTKNIDDVAQVAKVAQECRKLRNIRIGGLGFANADDCLPPSTIRAFLPVENLTVLALDLSSIVWNSPGNRDDSRHFCPAIGATLRTLRTLHLRMNSICPDVLRTQDANGSLRLSVLAIN